MNIKEIPDIAECVEVGCISRPHGTDGEVLVSLKNIDAEDFSNRKYVFFRLQERLVPFFIESTTLKSNSVFVKFDGIETLTRAELYVSTKLYVESDGIEDQDEESTDIEGFTVINGNTGQPVGIIREVIAYSMNVVLDVQRANGESALIPYADELVQEFDEQQKLIVMHIPDGLLE